MVVVGVVVGVQVCAGRHFGICIALHYIGQANQLQSLPGGRKVKLSLFWVSFLVVLSANELLTIALVWSFVHMKEGAPQ